MKKIHLKIFLTFILLMVFGGSFFQIKAQSDSLENKEFPNVAIEENFMNILYIGLPNPLSIAVSGYSQDEIIVKISEGTITKNGNEYIAKVSTWGEVSISIFAIEKDSSLKLLRTKNYRTRDLPETEIHTRTPRKEHFICLDIIKNNPEKAFSRLNDTFKFRDISYTVTSFNFTIINKEGEIESSLKVEGNKLNEACKKTLIKVDVDFKIVIDDIKAFGNEKKVNFAPYVILVL